MKPSLRTKSLPTGAARSITVITTAILLTGITRADVIRIDNAGDAMLLSADMNEDGNEDILVVNREDRSLEIFLNDDEEPASFSKSSRISLPHGVASAIVGRLDHEDSFLDVVVTNARSGVYTAAFGDGGGGFSFVSGVPRHHDAPSSVSKFLVLDADGDGLLDGVYLGRVSEVTILLPLFAPQRLTTFLTTVEDPRFVVSGDFDLDNEVELAVWGLGSADHLVFYEQNGTGDFVQAHRVRRLPRPGGKPSFVSVADFDGDSADDLMLFTQAERNDKVIGFLYFVRWRAPDGFEARRLGPEITFGTRGVFSGADLNGDAWPDLLMATRENGIDILMNEREMPPSLLSCRVPGGNYSSLVVSDFDGDGLPDLAAADIDESRVEFRPAFVDLGCRRADTCYERILESSGHSFRDFGVVDSGHIANGIVTVGEGEVRVLVLGPNGLRTLASLPAPKDAGSVLVEDLDGDGDDDLVLGRPSGIEIYRLTDEFRIEGRTFADTGGRADGLTTIDLKPDGTRGLIVALPDLGQIALVQESSDARDFSIRHFAAGSNATRVAVGNLNGDEWPDLVVTNAGSRWISMLEGNSIGEFEAPQTWRVAEDPLDVIVSDLDGNGLDEVLVVSCATEALSVVLDAAAGHRLKIVELPPGSAPSEILVRDMDQDGEDEVLVLRSGSRSVALLDLSSTGEVANEVVIAEFSPIEDEEVQASVGDFDGDGWQDVLFGTISAGSLTVFSGAGCGRESALPFRRGDVNGDGEVELADAVANLAFQFLGTFESECLDALDFDDNGEIEVTDPLASLLYEFRGAQLPPSPGPFLCGPDPTEDSLPRCGVPCIRSLGGG